MGFGRQDPPSRRWRHRPLPAQASNGVGPRFASIVRVPLMLKPTSRVRPDAYEAVFSALAHHARRRVLLAIYFNGGAMTAGEIAAIFAHAWQTTTRHLQVLEGAGLIGHERQGRMRIYRLEHRRLALVSEWLAHFQRPARRRTRGEQDAKNKDTRGYQSDARKARSA